MRLAISWVPDNLRTYPELVRATEAAGFELLGVPDTQASVYRESYVTLTTAALNSTQLRIGPWVTNPVTRHPAVTASALASLHELAPGRVLAALATGDTSVRNLDLRPASLAALEAYVHAVRTMLRGQPAQWRGRTARLLWAQGGVPLFIAAGGPRTLELAGAQADGVVIGLPLTPETVAAAETALARGAARAGRDARRIERWWRLTASVADTYEEAVTLALPPLASMAKNAFHFTLEGKGLPEQWLEPIRELQARYDVTAHNRPGADSPNGLLVRELGLVDFLVERFGVIGTPRQVVERLRELETLGVTGVALRVQTPDRFGFLRVWHEEMVAALR